MDEKERSESFVAVEFTGPVFNIDEYIGKRVKISRVVSGVYSYQDKETPYVDLFTDVVGTDNFGKDIVAKVRFWLLRYSDGAVIYLSGSRPALFLKKYGVKRFEELIGKEVILQAKFGKNGRSYLTFI